MGFRYRKRVRLAPGVSLNLSKSGPSISVGPRGAKVNIRRGRTRVSAGVPGTGLSYQRQVSPPSRQSQNRTAQVASTVQKIQGGAVVREYVTRMRTITTAVEEMDADFSVLLGAGMIGDIATCHRLSPRLLGNARAIEGEFSSILVFPGGQQAHNALHDMAKQRVTALGMLDTALLQQVANPATRLETPLTAVEARMAATSDFAPMLRLLTRELSTTTSVAQGSNATPPQGFLASAAFARVAIGVATLIVVLIFIAGAH